MYGFSLKLPIKHTEHNTEKNGNNEIAWLWFQNTSHHFENITSLLNVVWIHSTAEQKQKKITKYRSISIKHTNEPIWFLFLYFVDRNWTFLSPIKSIIECVCVCVIFTLSPSRSLSVYEANWARCCCYRVCVVVAFSREFFCQYFSFSSKAPHLLTNTCADCDAVVWVAVMW